MATPHEWDSLFTAVYHQPMVSLDALLVHGWGDLRDEMLEFAARHFKASGARAIILNGEPMYDRKPGTPGFSYWAAELVKRGIPSSSIHSIVPGLHTLDEAEGFIRHARDKGFERLGILTVPQHLLRAFLTDLAVMQRTGSARKLYPYTVSGIDWEASIEIHGMNGAEAPEHTTRAGRLVSECARIMEYRERMERGERFTIASISEGLSYLASRDEKI